MSISNLLALRQRTAGPADQSKDSLPFRRPAPTDHQQSPAAAEIPRYLFRVSSPNCPGWTTKMRVMSPDAQQGHFLSRTDILARRDKKAAARTLHNHLVAGQATALPLSDNLVSWTSSLLCALVSIFFRLADDDDDDHDGLADIHLCVVDTTLFPERTFVSDAELIRAFRPLDHRLRRVLSRRRGRWCNGEYLSQGTLDVDAKCEAVSAAKLVDAGLFRVVPELQQKMLLERRRGGDGIAPPLRPWEEVVVGMRRRLDLVAGFRRELTRPGAVQAALDVARLFGARFKLPVAASLLALWPYRHDDERILLAFRSNGGHRFTDSDRDDCQPARTKIIPLEMMSEVACFADLMSNIHKDHCAHQLKGILGQALAVLRQRRYWNIKSQLEDHATSRSRSEAKQQAAQPTLIDRGLGSLLEQLDEMQGLQSDLRSCLLMAQAAGHPTVVSAKSQGSLLEVPQETFELEA